MSSTSRLFIIGMPTSSIRSAGYLDSQSHILDSRALPNLPSQPIVTEDVCVIYGLDLRRISHHVPPPQTVPRFGPPSEIALRNNGK